MADDTFRLIHSPAVDPSVMEKELSSLRISELMVELLLAFVLAKEVASLPAESWIALASSDPEGSL